LSIKLLRFLSGFAAQDFGGVPIARAGRGAVAAQADRARKKPRPKQAMPSARASADGIAGLASAVAAGVH
jgi:hypothetical protein